MRPLTLTLLLLSLVGCSTMLPEPEDPANPGTPSPRDPAGELMEPEPSPEPDPVDDPDDPGRVDEPVDDPDPVEPEPEEYELPSPNVQVSNINFEGEYDGYMTPYGPANTDEVKPFAAYYGGWFYVIFHREDPGGGIVSLRMQFSHPKYMSDGTIVTYRDRPNGYLLTRVRSGDDLDSLDFGELAAPQEIRFFAGPEEGTFEVLFDLEFGGGDYAVGDLLITDCDVFTCS